MKAYDIHSGGSLSISLRSLILRKPAAMSCLQRGPRGKELTLPATAHEELKPRRGPSSPE